MDGVCLNMVNASPEAESQIFIVPFFRSVAKLPSRAYAVLYCPVNMEPKEVGPCHVHITKAPKGSSSVAGLFGSCVNLQGE